MRVGVWHDSVAFEHNRLVARTRHGKRRRQPRDAPPAIPNLTRRNLTPTSYFTSVSILNIGRYMLMMMMPTMIPTPIIISGSMIDVSAWIAASTSSS
jgi:hypothetical protein